MKKTKKKIDNNEKKTMKKKSKIKKKMNYEIIKFL